MKIKVSELSGAKLDFFVARAAGKQTHIEQYSVGVEECWIRTKEFPSLISYSPSTNWLQGGPIIEDERICIRGPGPMGGPSPEYEWTTYIDTGSYAGGGFTGNGRTPLIAAMRCLVASRFGDEVEDAKE